MSKDKFLTTAPHPEAPNNYAIVWNSGAGKIPKELQGMWTLRAALTAIEHYNEKGK